MHWIYMIIVFYLLFTFNNGRDLKEIQKKIHSRLHKKTSVLKSSNSISRQSHSCYSGCFFIFRFNDSFVPPNDCKPVVTNSSCEIMALISYEDKEFIVYTFATANNLIIDNITYDASISHIAELGFQDNLILHSFEYTCAIGDLCEWEYMKEIMPKLINLDYKPLFDLLLPNIYNSNSHPNKTECYSNNIVVNCSIGTCEFFENVLNDRQLIRSRFCGLFEETYVEVSTAQYLPGPAKHDSNEISFTCNKNRCNDEINENEIKRLVSIYGNEYIRITYSKTNAQIINFSLFFLCLIFYKIF